MTRFAEQMRQLLDPNIDYDNVFHNADWTEADIRCFFWMVDKGYLIQGDYSDIFCHGFVVNPEWEDEPLFQL